MPRGVTHSLQALQELEPLVTVRSTPEASQPRAYVQRV